MRILLLHWNAAEAVQRVERLRSAGFQAEYFARTDSDGGFRVIRENPPDGFRAKLEPLPRDVRLQNRPDGAAVILVFQKSAATLGREIPLLARDMKEGRTLWLIWPKKTSGVASDLSEPIVREMGLAVGLVDFKVCAVDETWSGLAFAARRTRAPVRRQ